MKVQAVCIILAIFFCGKTLNLEVSPRFTKSIAIIVVCVTNIAVSAFIGDYLPGHTRYNTIVRHILCDNTVGADCHIVADLNGPNDNCPGTYIHVVADFWYSGPFPPAMNADGNAVGYVTVPANFCFRVDNNTAVMTNVKAGHYFGVVWDTDAKFSADAVQYNP